MDETVTRWQSSRCPIVVVLTDFYGARDDAVFDVVTVDRAFEGNTAVDDAVLDGVVLTANTVD